MHERSKAPSVQGLQRQIGRWGGRHVPFAIDSARKLGAKLATLTMGIAIDPSEAVGFVVGVRSTCPIRRVSPHV